jgi:hypothetical protein
VRHQIGDNGTTIYLVDENSAILKSTAKTKMEGR